MIVEIETYFESKEKFFYKKVIEKLEGSQAEYITLEREYFNE